MTITLLESARINAVKARSNAIRMALEEAKTHACILVAEDHANRVLHAELVGRISEVQNRAEKIFERAG